MGRVRVGGGTDIGNFSVIGKPYRKIKGRRLRARPMTVLGRNCQIGANVTIMKGTHVRNRVAIDDHCYVEQDVDIGGRTILTYHAIVCNGARIGDDCIIGGFIGERCRVGADSRVFGSLVHRQDDPAADWDSLEEPAPVLGHHVLVGFGAVVIGDITVGPRSIIGAGALVTKKVAAGSIVTGKDKAVHHSESDMTVAQSNWFRRK